MLDRVQCFGTEVLFVGLAEAQVILDNLDPAAQVGAVGDADIGGGDKPVIELEGLYVDLGLGVLLSHASPV